MNTRYNWIPEVFNDFFNTEYPTHRSATAPAVNVIETEKGYTVKIAAPGLTKDDFHVSLTSEGNLSVKMEKHTDSNEQNGRYLRREWDFAKYEQAFTLPDDVDREKIQARVADGVLTVELPKIGKEEAKVSRSIEIG